jgi:hypothetical protein
MGQESRLGLPAGIDYTPGIEVCFSLFLPATPPPVNIIMTDC